MAQMSLWVAAALVAAQGGWLGLGALENIRGPKANGEMVADVMAMRELRAELPDMYAIFGANRVELAAAHRLAFIVIVIAELIAAILMLAGAVGLAGSALGLWQVAAPLVVSTLGVLGFTLVWAAFLVGGQWFHYWAVYQNAQHTHLMLAIWGGVTLAILLRI